METPTRAAAQHAHPADPLDRGVFEGQNQAKAVPIYRCHPFQRAADAQGVRPPFCHTDYRNLDMNAYKLHCRDETPELESFIIPGDCDE